MANRLVEMSSSPARESQVQRELASLFGHIDDVENALSTLYEKVSPVRRMRPPSPATPDKSVMEVLVPLAEEIRRASYKARDIAASVHDIVGELEL